MRRLVLPVLLVAASPAADGHGWLTLPPSRNGGGLDDDIGACLRDSYYNHFKNISVTNDCMWFTSSTTIPGEPTLCDPALLTTSTSIAHPCSADHARDWTRKHPWRSPGTAPVIHPCGTHCTASAGDSCSWGAVSGPIWGKGHANQVNWTSLPPPPPGQPRTMWRRGGVAEVATGIAILHSGGWSYRLCPADTELTESCFQRGALRFHTDTAQVRPVHNSSSLPFTIAVRHTPDRKWTRIPVPAPDTPMPAPWCKSPEILLQKENSSYRGAASDTRYTCLGTYPNTTGMCRAGDGWCWQGTHPAGGEECCDCKGTCIEAKEALPFPSPFSSQAGRNLSIQNPWTFSLVETVDVPADLAAGDYVLSWRWDAEATPQVWLNCADVTLV
eukprot:COSAG01_NODE_11685_length_1879_cov_22.393820_1_plen_386_part_00